MAFWGTEVKPGKPVTHSFDATRGRLRISQATLGIGTAIKKSLVQCNIGKKSPVFLCALLPDKIESCHLDLEFEETVDVIFSVIGPRSVYLTGYYVGHSRHRNLNSDSETYGEDIANTETEESVRGSTEDDYEDSFINDGDPGVMPPSPVSSDRETINEEMLKKKLKHGKGGEEVRRKNYKCIVSDDDDSSQKSEDDENYLFSVFKNKKSTKSTASEAEEKNGKVTAQMCDNMVVCGTDVLQEIEDEDNCLLSNFKNKRYARSIASEEGPEDGKVALQAGDKTEYGGICGSGFEESTDVVTSDGKSDRSPFLQCNSGKVGLKEDGKLNKRREKLPEKQENPEDNSVFLGNADTKVQQDKANITSGTQDMQTFDSELIAQNGVNAKKKRKDRSKEAKTSEVDNANHCNGLKVEAVQQDKADPGKLLKNLTEKHTREPAKNMEIDGLHNSLTLATELDSGEGSRPKKRRKEWIAERHSVEEDDVKCDNISQEDQLHKESVTSHEIHKDMSARVTEDPRSSSSRGIHCSSQVAADVTCQLVKNVKKKKKKKNKSHEDGPLLSSDVSLLSEKEKSKASVIPHDENIGSTSSHTRTLSNGLVIQELETGEPNGKVAVPGKKVKVHYTAMLKESGQVVDSSIGKDPYKFRLGEKETMEGWNMGLEGMRVGGKRRVTLPPSMSFGRPGSGENVPPNSWLVYDIELVSVRR